MFKSTIGNTQDALDFQWQSKPKQPGETYSGLGNTYGNQALLRMGRTARIPSVTPLRPSQGIMLQRKSVCDQTSEKKIEGGVQPKLASGSPADSLEQEADRVAVRVLLSLDQPIAVSSVNNSQVQRKCTECEVEDKKLRRKENEIGIETSSSVVPPVVHEVLGALGQSLDPATRDFFEPRLGYDFSQVRVHTNEKAAESARAVNALAYTVGNNVVFDRGRYLPETPQGRNLLAHELTHVTQQRCGLGAVLQKATKEVGAEELSEQESKTTEIETTGGENADQLEVKPTKTPKCTRDIFAEGTCANLVAGSRFICCDPENGIKREGQKTDIEKKPCPSEKFTPIFTCDNNCKNALSNGCSDTDNWMALPNNQFTKSQCGDTWTICANGKQTTGYVRDHSVTQTNFEVSPKIQNDLGIKVGTTFKGSIYQPTASQKIIDKDSCCKV